MRFDIGILHRSPKTCEMLSRILIAVAATDGSVSLRHFLALGWRP